MEITLNKADRELMKKLTASIELLAACVDKGNTKWEEGFSEEIADETVMCCNVCEKDFVAGEEAVVRTPGGDVFCVSCYQLNSLKLKVIRP